MRKEERLNDPNILKTIMLCSAKVFLVLFCFLFIWLTKHSIWDFIKTSSSFFYSYYTIVQYYIFILSGLLSLTFFIAIQRTGKDYTDTIKAFRFCAQIFSTLFIICGISIVIPYLIIYFENKDLFEIAISSYMIALLIIFFFFLISYIGTQK